MQKGKKSKEEKKKEKRLSLFSNEETTKGPATCFNCHHGNQMNEPFDWPVMTVRHSALQRVTREFVCACVSSVCV